MTTLTLSSEGQSARMSKITNDSLTPSGKGCFIAVPIMATAGVKGLKQHLKLLWSTQLSSFVYNQ